MRRVHDAWVVVGVCLMALLAAQGARLSFGPFMTTWGSEFGAGRGEISLISTVSFPVYGVTRPIAGQVVDRHGARWVLSFPVRLAGVALAAATLARTPTQLAVLYGVRASIGFGGTSGVVASVAITRWFARNREPAFGLIEAGSGAGQMLLIDVYGWRSALLVPGALAAVPVFPLTLGLPRDSPEQLGMTPYGGALPVPAGAGSPGAGAGHGGVLGTRAAVLRRLVSLALPRPVRAPAVAAEVVAVP